MTFLLRYDGVVPEFRASPGLDSISPPSVSFVILGSLVCGRFGREWKRRNQEAGTSMALDTRRSLDRSEVLAGAAGRACSKSVCQLSERTHIVLDIILRAQHNTKRSLSL